MNRPAMAGWNLSLRFALELVALAGLAAGAWRLTSGAGRIAALIVVPLAAATIWGVFNVFGDPSRSGAAPVEVPGWARLVIELLILGGGVAGFAVAGRPLVATVLAVLIVFHYLASWSRIRWLLEA